MTVGSSCRVRTVGKETKSERENADAKDGNGMQIERVICKVKYQVMPSFALWPPEKDPPQ